jgi:transcription elongation factor GreA
MTSPNIQITQSKKEELELELKELKEVKRAEISERVATARAHGDLSENAEYHAARTAQAKNEGRIQEIEYILKHSEILERTNSDIVELGATVTLQKIGAGTEHLYMVVSPEEADMAGGKLSVTSPLGACVINKKTGDTCTIETPKGKVEYKVVKIA